MTINQITRVNTISQFHKIKGLPSPKHPLISIIHYEDIVKCTDNVETINWLFDYYQISLKKGIGAKLKYGQQQYDYDDGIMFFISPGQIFGIEPVANHKEKRSGWMLLIHPDLFWNSTLAKSIKQYEYFQYSVNEALFLSEKEEEILNQIIKNIEREYNENIDDYSQNIIISHVETLLNYSERFYQRQFITRKKSSHQILQRLEAILLSHFQSKQLINKGVPTVQEIADELHLSPSYLSGLLKSLTGQSTLQHIHEKLIEKAKEKLSTSALSVSEIAYELGFDHTQSFSKLFKSKVGQSPLEFRTKFN